MDNKHLLNKDEIEHIFHQQSEQTQSFLIQSSILAELHPSVINDYLEMNHAIQALHTVTEETKLLIRDEDGLYHLPYKVRDYLYNLLKLQRDSSYPLYEQHLQIAEIYEQANLYLPAFIHYVAGKNYFQATRMIRIARDRYNEADFITLLSKSLETGTANIFSLDFDVFLIRCVPLSALENLIPKIEQKIAEYKKSEQYSLLAHSKYRLATIHIYLGNISEAQQIYKQSLDISVNIALHDKITLNHLGIAETYMFSDNNEQASYYVKRALFYSEKFQYTYYQTYSLWLLSAIYLEKDNYDIAKPYLEQTMEFRRKLEDDDSGKTFSYCSMSKYARYEKNHIEAIKWAEQALNHALNYGNELDIGLSYVELGKNYMAIEQWDQAENYLNNAYTMYKHFDYYRSVAIYLQMILFNLKGDFTKAQEKRQKLLEISKRKNFKMFLTKLAEQNFEITERPRDYSLKIETLGHFVVTLNGETIMLNRSSSLKLLQLFIAHRGEKLTQEYILEKLFPNQEVESMSNHFYVALSTLRKFLEPNLKSGRSSMYIIQAKKHYTFQTDALFLDVEKFIHLVNQKTTSISTQIKNLLKAEELYKGDFFAEYPYEEFLETEREKLRLEYIDVLNRLAQLYWNPEDYEKGIEYYEKILSFDPYHDIIYLEYIERLLHSHLYLQAKSVANRYIKHIENELGIVDRTPLNRLFEQHSLDL